MTLSDMCLFLVVPLVGLWSLIVAFPGQLFFYNYNHKELKPVLSGHSKQ